MKKLKTEDPYAEIRLGGIMARSLTWWEDNNEEDDDDSSQQPQQAAGQEWSYLEHHAVLIPQFYKRHNVPLIYNNQKIQLTQEQEELSTYWSQTIGTPWQDKERYRNNFETLMRSKFPGFELSKADFTLIRKHLDEQRELRLNRSDETKKQEKLDKEQRDKIYGLALVDGCLERVGNYTLEPPTLFKGRGDHPKAGLLKARIMPEDLTINVSSQAPVPRCTLPGHSWGNIVHRNDVTWLVSYVDSSIRKDNHKYVQFAATSRFKQMNDKRKYEKARKLKECIKDIRKDYQQKLVSENAKQRQLGTATYLIDKLALRVGNEKDEDEADTVGCCSLRVEHIQLKENDTVVFDFLGKDSMRYYNEVQLEHQVWKNMKYFQKGKGPDQNLFDEISADDLNEYLKTQMVGLTAKVFRTYNASYTLQEQLDKGQQQINNVDLEKKVDYYDYANKQVAILCNHQKTIPKSFEITKQKITARIEVYEQYLRELENHYSKQKKGSNIEEYEEEVEIGVNEEQSKGKKQDKEKQRKANIFIKKFPGSKDKTQGMIKKMEQKIEKERNGLTKKEENKEIALGTSKTNYNDPRISVTWCKMNDVPIEKVFPKTLRSKFIWAMGTDPSWKF